MISYASLLQVAKEATAQSLDPAKIKKIYVLSALMVSRCHSYCIGYKSVILYS